MALVGVGSAHAQSHTDVCLPTIILSGRRFGFPPGLVPAMCKATGRLPDLMILLYLSRSEEDIVEIVVLAPRVCTSLPTRSNIAEERFVQGLSCSMTG